MNFGKKSDFCSSRGIFPPDQFKGREHAIGHAMRSPSILRALERGQSLISGPASSAAVQSRNVSLRENIVKSVIRTTVVVINSHLLKPPHLEMVDGNESQPSSLEAFPIARIPMRNRREYTNPQQEVPNPFQHELSP